MTTRLPRSRSRAVLLGSTLGALLLLGPAATAQGIDAGRRQRVAEAAPLKPQAHPRLAAFKIHVRDLEEAIRYYDRVLGMKFIGPVGSREALLSYPGADIPPSQPKGSLAEPILVLVLDPAYARPDSRVADVVFRVTDTEAARKIAEAAGSPMLSPAGARSPHFRDPSGNVIELVADGYLTPQP